MRGAAGWGEFSPFWDYDAAESVAWWRAAREAADVGWPAPVRTRIPVNVTVPAVDAETAHRIVRASGGCRTAKVKVAEPGQSLADEIARLEAVRDALGPGGRIRVDANAAWDVDTAVARLAALDRAAGGLEYAEQPVPGVDDLAALRRRTHVPIAADESIRRAEDPLAVARAHAADVVVLKVQPLGGVRACLELAERIGLPVVVSSALESSVGLAAGRRARGRAPRAALRVRPRHRAAVRTTTWSRDPFRPVDGALDVRRPDPDPDRLAAATRARRARPPGGSPGSAVEARLGRGSGMMAGVTPPPLDPDPATTAARVLVQALAALGVEDVVLAPGSRSAPLAYALADAARPDDARPAGAPRLRLHVRVDERSAAFLAVGLARASAHGPGDQLHAPRPVAVVTTSGTAVANLHPAVLEAHHSGLPLDPAHGGPPARAARHGRQPDHRPGRHLRRRRPARGRRPGPRRPARTRPAACAGPSRAPSPPRTGARTGTPVRCISTSRSASRSCRAARRGRSRRPRASRSCRRGTWPRRPPRARCRPSTPRRRRVAAAWRPCSSRGTAPAPPRAGSRRPTGGRCWPSRRPAPAAARTRSRPTGCCWSTRSWGERSGGSSCSVAPRCPGPCSSCSPGRTSRSS